MALKITDDCTSCGACEAECPNDAISEGDSQYQIDKNKCTECVGFFDTPQCADVCPTDSCVDDPANKESEEQLIAKLKKICPSKTFTGKIPSRYSK
jgi:ferredoxin